MSSYLTKFFIKVWCVNQGSFINFFIIEVVIPWNEEGAQEFLHFYCDIHGDRNDKVEYVNNDLAFGLYYVNLKLFVRKFVNVPWKEIKYSRGFWSKFWKCGATS